MTELEDHMIPNDNSKMSFLKQLGFGIFLLGGFCLILYLILKDIPPVEHKYFLYDIVCIPPFHERAGIIKLYVTDGQPTYIVRYKYSLEEFSIKESDIIECPEEIENYRRELETIEKLIDGPAE